MALHRRPLCCRRRRLRAMDALHLGNEAFVAGAEAACTQRERQRQRWLTVTGAERQRETERETEREVG